MFERFQAVELCIYRHKFYFNRSRGTIYDVVFSLAEEAARELAGRLLAASQSRAHFGAR